LSTVPKSVYPTRPETLPKSLGFSRYSLEFDGVEDYVGVPYSSELNPDIITVLAWIYPTANERTGVVIHGDRLLRRWDTGANASVTDSAGTTFEISAGDWMDSWKHVAMTYDKNTLALYINGEQVNSASADGNPLQDHTDDIWTGRRLWGDEYFTGKIDEPMIYDRVLSQSEIRSMMLNYHAVSKDGLVGWWRFEEGTGLTAHDKSGNGNDGTLNPSDDPPAWKDVKKWEFRARVGL